MQFSIVLLESLVLFPSEQPHFIIAFCVSTRSIFSIYSLHICPRRAVCVRLFSVGLTLSRIHTATHWGPSLHPPSSPWKPTSSCQRPFRCGPFQANLLLTPNLGVCGAACQRRSVLGFAHVVSCFSAVTPPHTHTHTNRGQVCFNNTAGFCLTSTIIYSVGEIMELRPQRAARTQACAWIQQEQV